MLVWTFIVIAVACNIALIYDSVIGSRINRPIYAMSCIVLALLSFVRLLSYLRLQYTIAYRRDEGPLMRTLLVELKETYREKYDAISPQAQTNFMRPYAVPALFYEVWAARHSGFVGRILRPFSFLLRFSIWIQCALRVRIPFSFAMMAFALAGFNTRVLYVLVYPFRALGVLDDVNDILADFDQTRFHAS